MAVDKQFATATDSILFDERSSIDSDVLFWTKPAMAVKSLCSKSQFRSSKLYNFGWLVNIGMSLCSRKGDGGNPISSMMIPACLGSFVNGVSPLGLGLGCTSYSFLPLTLELGICRHESSTHKPRYLPQQIILFIVHHHDVHSI